MLTCNGYFNNRTIMYTTGKTESNARGRKRKTIAMYAKGRLECLSI